MLVSGKSVSGTNEQPAMEPLVGQMALADEGNVTASEIAISIG
jgi:hypothetical protein